MDDHFFLHEFIQTWKCQTGHSRNPRNLDFFSFPGSFWWRNQALIFAAGGACGPPRKTTRNTMAEWGWGWVRENDCQVEVKVIVDGKGTGTICV